MTIQALSTLGLAKRFGSLVVASDITLTIPQGVRYALIGPNGAGKTTLINLITGMERPDAGKIFLGDAEITKFKPDARVKQGLVRTFQINALFPQLFAKNDFLASANSTISTHVLHPHRIATNAMNRISIRS